MKCKTHHKWASTIHSTVLLLNMSKLREVIHQTVSLCQGGPPPQCQLPM